MQDILQALPIDKWNLLEDSLKHNWPAYAYVSYKIIYLWIVLIKLLH